MTRIIRYIIAGALGAILAWAIMEPTSLLPDTEQSVSYGATVAIGMICGLFIGLAMGMAEAMSGLSARDRGRSVLMGALVGAAGGILGLSFGQAFYSMIGSVSSATPGLFSFLLLLIGRGFGWALIGMFIGVSQGLATGSAKKMINGAIGGLIGGGLGGSVFEILVWMNTGEVANFPPQMIRFISFSITGAGIGLWIGVIEEVAKQAWLVRLVGNNEGRHYDLYKAVTLIGRSELADIPVFSDPDVAERHAAVTAQGKAYAVEDLGSPFGTTVNGARISKEALRDGDVISAGKTKFLFRDKATARLDSTYSVQGGGVSIPASQHICPFCGSIKDASGNCECSVGAPQPAAAQPTAQPTVQQPAMRQATQIPAPATVSAGSGPRLVAMSGPYAGQAFPLRSGETHIGRDASRDIPLPHDSTASRSHARIAQEVTSYVLYDTGSTNGSYVNGDRVQRRELAVGDVIQIGNSKFKFEE